MLKLTEVNTALPLHLAAKQGNPDVVQLLLTRDMTFEIWGSKTRHSALSWAPRLGNNEALAVPVRDGANVNISLDDYLHLASGCCGREL